MQQQQLTGLIEACKNQETPAQESLYRYCYPQFIGVCTRYAPDMDSAGTIFNNSMLRVFKYISSYEEKGQFLAWVKKIVVNCCLDYARKNVTLPATASLDEAGHSLQIDPSIQDHYSLKEIRKLVQSLPPATALVFKLFIYEGLTHAEIGKALGIAEGSSKWHVSEGRKLLVKMMQKNVKIKTEAK